MSAWNFDKKNDGKEQYTHHVDFDFLNLETKNDCPNQAQNETWITCAKKNI